MLPTNFKEANFTFEKPVGISDEDCLPLTVFRGIQNFGNVNFPVILSRWMPSKEDIEEINKGNPIWLSIMGETMPPVSIYTEDPFE